MKVYIIRCNDSVEAGVLHNRQKAEMEKDKMELVHFKETKKNNWLKTHETFEEYQHFYVWFIVEVQLI